MEQWREIKGFPNYEVSDRGRIRNARTKNIKYSWIHKQTKYEHVQLWKCGKTYTIQVHRLVARAFIGENNKCRCCGAKKEVHHMDHDKGNNKADNLMYVTGEENRQHYQASKKNKL